MSEFQPVVVNVTNLDELKALAARVGVTWPKAGVHPKNKVVFEATKQGIFVNMSNYQSTSKPKAAAEKFVEITAVSGGKRYSVVASVSEVREANGLTGKRGATSKNVFREFALNQWGLSEADLVSGDVQIWPAEAPKDEAKPSETVAKPRKAARKGKDTSKASEAASEPVKAENDTASE